MPIIRTILLSCMLGIMVFSMTLALPVGTAAPDFKLKDQYGKQWVLSNLRGKVVVITVATKRSGNDIGPWVDALKKKYSDNIIVLPLIDLHTVPGIGRGIARSRVREETKDPVVLDFNGSTAKAYEASDKCPNAVVVDKKGILRVHQKSKYTNAAFQTVSEGIDASLK